MFENAYVAPSLLWSNKGTNFVVTLTLGLWPKQGLVIKARACKGANQKKSPWITSHAPRSVKECEGINPHTPKWALTWELKSWWTFKPSKRYCKGQNSLDWRVPYIITKIFKHICLKWVCMTHNGHLKHKLWPKEGLEVKLTIWFITIKSWESPQFPYVQVACNIPLGSFQWRLQLCFKSHFN
jgi:hypothetical protein